jgi:hypothetical protein
LSENSTSKTVGAERLDNRSDLTAAKVAVWQVNQQRDYVMMLYGLGHRRF